MKVYMEDRDEDEEAEDDEKKSYFGKKGDKIKLKEFVPAQHFTKPPARYTEASLVKVWEAQGIGRPSTYLQTISTVQARGYMKKMASSSNQRILALWSRTFSGPLSKVVGLSVYRAHGGNVG